MLIKLLKYDILADYKKYCAVYIAMLAASIMLLLSRNMYIDPEIFGYDVLVDLISSALTILSVAACVMVLVFSISRFYKNLVRDEGYLMHTLPVHTWELLLSKLMAVYIWTVSTVIMVIMCIGISTLGDVDLSEIISDLTEFLDFLFDTKGAMIYIAYVILTPFFAMSVIYFAFALGNLFSKNKLGASVLMYFAIKFAENMLTSIVNFLAIAAASNRESLESLSFLNNFVFARFMLSVILSAGYFIAAERIFAKKLNLE